MLRGWSAVVKLTQSVATDIRTWMEPMVNPWYQAGSRQGDSIIGVPKQDNT